MTKAFLLAGATVFLASAAAQAQPEDRRAKMVERLFERLDANEDGAVTAQEVTDSRLAAFREADANVDGVVDADEAEALRDADPERSRRRFPRRAAQQTDGDAPQRQTQFQRMDVNEDGLVTQDEFVERPVRLLEMDADADGAVTAQELLDGLPERGRRGPPPVE